MSAWRRAFCFKLPAVSLSIVPVKLLCPESLWTHAAAAAAAACD